MSTKIHFLFSPETVNRLTMEQYEALERAQEGTLKMYQLRPLLATFLVDVAEKPLPFEMAMGQLGKLKMDEVADVVQQFWAAMSGAAIPKGNGTSPSGASQVDGSRAGSTP